MTESTIANHWGVVAPYIYFTIADSINELLNDKGVCLVFALPESTNFPKYKSLF